LFAEYASTPKAINPKVTGSGTNPVTLLFQCRGYFSRQQPSLPPFPGRIPEGRKFALSHFGEKGHFFHEKYFTENNFCVIP
jgi:hypothetical protein